MRPPDSPQFAGTVVLVTGAGRGIGRAIAELFARHGASVVANDIGAHVTDVEASISRDGGTAVGVVADVSQKSDVDRLFDTALERFGDVNVLVNNAGLVNESRHFLTGDEAWWDRVLATNLKSVFLCTHRAAWLMARRKGGCVINMSSGGATRAHRGNCAYDATKGGIEAFTRATALDLAPYGIRVNAIAPGSIATGPLTEAESRERGRAIPLGRMGTPDDIASVAVFLASDQARYMTGHTVAVDGGLLSQQRSPQVDIFPLELFPKVDPE
ncbi:MAG: SDR family oxidoreductase [Chloroflexi bacterium]|nr:SDR family oxidoreductase [Chloroflexota bacterium]